MNKDIQIFSSNQFGQLRTVEDGDKVYFVAIDVAKALGYSNTRDAINKHCKGVAKRDVPHPQNKDKTVEVSVIPEGDVYRLITHSHLPAAEKFESWVFDEVLPTIRKHGAYATPDTLDKMIASPEFGIKLLTALKEEQSRRRTASSRQNWMRRSRLSCSPRQFPHLTHQSLLAGWRSSSSRTVSTSGRNACSSGCATRATSSRQATTRTSRHSALWKWVCSRSRKAVTWTATA